MNIFFVSLYPLGMPCDSLETHSVLENGFTSVNIVNCYIMAGFYGKDVL